VRGAALPTARRGTARDGRRGARISARRPEWHLLLMSHHHMNYIETDAPEGVTLADWRRTRLAPPRRRRRWLRTFVPAGRPAFA